MTKTMICRVCNKRKLLDKYYFNKTLEVYKKTCKSCQSIINKERNLNLTAEERAKRRQYNRTWRAENYEKRKEELYKWREKNREHYNNYTKLWRKANKKKVCVYTAKHLLNITGLSIEELKDLTKIK